MRAPLALLAALLIAACSRPKVEPGAKVVLDYELSSGGAVIESTEGKEPLVVTQGEGAFPGRVDEALAGMAVGEEKVLDLTVDQGFGPVDPLKKKNHPLAGKALRYRIRVLGTK